MKAVTYARVSGDDRGKGNLESQTADCRTYCQEHGYSIVAELQEDEKGVSGAIRLPPQIEHALDMAEEGTFSVLVVRELDRLARGIAKQLNLEAMFSERGVRIEYVEENFDDSPEGQLFKTFKAGIAEYERTKIAIRMRRGRRWRVKQGRFMLHGDNPPYGYRAEEERDELGNISAKWLTVYEPEAKIIRLIFKWYVRGDETGKRLSQTAIAQKLTEMGVPTWSDVHGTNFERKADYGEWARSAIAKILVNQTYIGTWHYGKRGRSNTNPKDNWLAIEAPEIAIIEPEVFKAAQKRKGWNKRFYSKKTVVDYLLRGHVVCGHCQTEMIGRAEKGGKYSYYICPRAHGRHIGQTCPNNGYFASEDVDVTAWYELQANLYDPETLRQKLRNRREYLEQVNAPTLEQLEATDRLIEKHKRRLDKALSAFLDDRWDEEMLESVRLQESETIASLEKHKAELEQELSGVGLLDLSEESINWLCKVAETLCLQQWRAYDDVNFEEKRRFVESLNCQAVLSVREGEKETAFRFYLSPPVDTKPHIGGG
jgi:site-specific DNA recombinase